jgi:pilus assembly protein CpaB
MLAGAIVLGGAAIALTRGVIDSRVARVEHALREGQVQVRVVVARRDLARGEPVNGTNFAVREIPTDYAHASAVRPEAFDRVERQRLGSALRRGEALLEEHLDGGAGAVFSALLKPGRRALTVEVDDRNSIAGLLRPGDRIDLLVSVRAAADDPGAAAASRQDVTYPLLAGVEVLATGQTVRRSDAGSERSYSNVTLDLAPAEAMRVIVARAAGTLSAVLRHPDDALPDTTVPLALDEALGRPRHPAARSSGVDLLIGHGSGGEAP